MALTDREIERLKVAATLEHLRRCADARDERGRWRSAMRCYKKLVALGDDEWQASRTTVAVGRTGAFISQSAERAKAALKVKRP